MKISTTFRDPQSATKLLCDAILADEPAPPAYLEGLRITTQLPREEAPHSPLLVVNSGAWDDYQAPLTASNRVRLGSWGPDPDALWDVLCWFHARLLAYRGGDDVVSFRYLEGPRRATDPDFDVPMAVAVIRARMRPEIV